MPATLPVITLLTDFGHQDPYVGVMKGQILRLCPSARLVDLTHEVPAQDVRTASFHLEQSVPYFPPGTVHLAVVDPGVGTERRMIAVRTESAMFVAPDNGLLTRALRLVGPPLEVVELPVPEQSSSTFHGRDVMAPAAARLASGQRPGDLGPSGSKPVELEFPAACLTPGRVRASVLVVDHFGNVSFDLPRSVGAAFFHPGSRWRLQGRELVMARTYAEVSHGASLLLWSSHGLLELACRQASAHLEFGLAPGQTVELIPLAGSKTNLE